MEERLSEIDDGLVFCIKDRKCVVALDEQLFLAPRHKIVYDITVESVFFVEVLKAGFFRVPVVTDESVHTASLGPYV